MSNYFEYLYDLNANDSSDASLDPDNDGLTNLEEFLAKTNPLVSNALSSDPNIGESTIGNTIGTPSKSEDNDTSGFLIYISFATLIISLKSKRKI